MRKRYELQAGGSNKFWEIALGGRSFTTTYGRIGTDGQSSRKDWDSEDRAKKEYEKLIAAKVKKGYRLVSGKKASAKPAPKAVLAERNDGPILRAAKKPIGEPMPKKPQGLRAKLDIGRSVFVADLDDEHVRIYRDGVRVGTAALLGSDDFLDDLVDPGRTLSDSVVRRLGKALAAARDEERSDDAGRDDDGLVRVLVYLRGNPGGTSIDDLAYVFQRPASWVSQQLRALERAQKVERDAKGLWAAKAPARSLRGKK